MDVGVSAVGLAVNQNSPWQSSTPDTGSPEGQQSARRNSRNDEQVRTRKQRSANHVKSRPANPAVISSILDSFDVLGAPSPVRVDDTYSDAGSLSSSKRLRPASPSTISSPSRIERNPPTPGFGMEYGSSSYGDYGLVHGAAPPPSIRTSRSPSGRAHYNAPAPQPSFTDLRNELRPDTVPSRTNSFSSQDRVREAASKNKHSAESWIMPHVPNRKSLRRINSRETLRQHANEIFDVPVPMGAGKRATLGSADLVVTHTAPATIQSERRRLYLVDSGETEVESPGSVTTAGSPHTSNNSKAYRHGSPVSSQRSSPVKSPIADSIPTRTSSLRLSKSGQPSSRKKDKSLKRLTVPAPSEIRDAIPESSWADLGDDDETVKRIRELRERRKTYMAESRTLSMPTEVPRIRGDSPWAAGDLIEAKPVPMPAPVPRQGTARQPLPRPAPVRSTTAPAIKAHKILGISIDERPMPSLTGSVGADGMSVSPVDPRQTPVRKENVPSHTTGGKPGSSSGNLPTPPLSLEYSYAQAVDALSGAEREIAKKTLPKRRMSVHSVASRVVATSPLAQSERNSEDKSSSRAKSIRRRPDPAARWTHHPDLPVGRRNSRRKSMSDARRTQHHEDDLPNMERRDSIELVVQDYLDAPRLSRNVKHPRDGRIISFSEVGDPKGAAVFVCVGMGLTRYVTAFYDDLATTLRLRLITIDRPGVGGSEPYPPNDRSGPLSWPDDVLAICSHLGITNFSLLAHSAGAVYALATALILPHLINGKVHLLAPWIPPSQLEATPHATAMPSAAGALPRGQRILRVLPSSFFKAANSSFMSATSASLKPASKRQIQASRAPARGQTSPIRAERPPTANRPDYHRRESLMLMDQFMPTTNPLENFPIPVIAEQEDDAAHPNQGRRPSLFLGATATPTDPTFEFAQAGLNAAEHAEKERQIEYTSRLTLRTWEMATRDSNPATDLLVCLERNREIGFRYTDVSRQVVITHGSEDKRVPLANVKWLSGQMNARTLAMASGWREAPGSREGWYDSGSSRGGCEVRILEGEGHGLMASAPIVSDVLTEIAGYWVGGEKRGMIR
ncbi:hypothetical protein LTR62_006058 [Meristemomyces frigidus]|uniref:AB hydrolase-1 domain-containing protein n=1 Tax=Meristemomyces frigidus TaxID=1508187 RepID=A0AAN7TC83_9PEZI|nr:hypothetical protein LTR62_006058 [Meristemomyces frigidus]